MKTLKESLRVSEALFSRKNLNYNPYRLTKNDLKDDLEGFPMGVVVRMLEEQELQGNKPDVTVFQKDLYANVKQKGFDWELSEKGEDWWGTIIDKKLPLCNFDLFFKEYPEYEMYNLS